MTTHHRRTARSAATAVAAAAAVALTGCGGEQPEAGDTTTDAAATTEPTGTTDATATTDSGAFAGPYDQAFAEEQEAYVGEQITLSAEVENVLDDDGFVLEGPGTESLLVVYDMDLVDIEEGQAVEVTGTLEQAFDLPTVEEDLQQDLEDELFEDHDQQPYLAATEVRSVQGG